MFELHVRCPTTGEPVHAGFQLTDGTTRGLLSEHVICPACGGKHDWQAAAVWSAIPVTPATEVPPDVPPFAFEAPREEAARASPDEPAWPRVA